MGECNFESRLVSVEKDGAVIMSPAHLVKRDRACCIGHFVTPLTRKSKESSYVEDYMSLPEYVLVDGVEFKKSDNTVIYETRHRYLCAEYYRVDYEGRIKTDDGRWEKDGIIRPKYPVFLHRRIHFHGTRMLTMKY